MWLLFGCSAGLPQAFDWVIDRTLVPGVAVRPGLVTNGGPRTVDALVLSPWPIEGVSVEVCGLRTDQVVQVGPECFGEPALIETVADALPATITVPAVTYDCASPDTGSTPPDPYYAFYDPCTSVVQLRVRAVSAEDQGFGLAPLQLSLYEGPSSEPLDLALVDLRVAVVEGVPEAGAEVRLEASEANAIPNTAPDVRWYVDGGELLSTGRTAFTRSGDRLVTLNTLRIPEDWSGPLRVAAISRGGRAWTVTTLEVP